jgi:hypothetical protein
MAHEFPSRQAITAQASTSQSLAKNSPCQLNMAILDGLERERLLVKGPGGMKTCALDLSRPLSPVQTRLHAAALEHVRRSSRSNSTIEERYTLAGVTAVVSSSAMARFASHMLAVSGRGHPTLGWDGDGVFRRTWDRAEFDRFGPHDRVMQSKADVDWRRQIMARLEDYPTLMARHPLSPWTRVYTAFHACRDGATALSICRTGFAALARLDTGYFAQGLYFGLELDYVLAQYGMDMLDADGRATVLVCDVVVGNVYPVIEHPHDPDPSRSLKGRPQV